MVKETNKSKDGKLTKRQKDILEYIKKFSAEKKYPPSIREIAANFSLSSPATAHVHVKKLIEKGYLTRGTGSNHLLELQVPNEYEKRSDDVVTVPLLGKVTAGNPIEAIEVPDEVISLPSYLLPKRKEVFTIRVEGDSMINAGIYDKDIVIVEKSKTAKNGDIVVAMDEENQVTIKRFYRENDYIRLQPENDYMLPIILKEATILGKAIGLYRKF
ncbi:MAG: transcriptional repressor LexA [Bacilli bacterium]